MKAQGIAVVAAVCLLACSDQGVRVEDPWIRAAPDGSALGAAYFVIENDGPGLSLEGVTSDAHAQASIHETQLNDGISRMRHIESLAIGRGERVRFAPGGLHVMLMRPQRALRVGDSVTLTLAFSNGRPLPVSVPVRRDPP